MQGVVFDRRATKRPRTARHSFLRARELGERLSATPREDLRTWIEGETLRKLDTGEYVKLDKTVALVRSTISIALSHDGRYFASTHGDHSVKVFEYPSRRQIACLDGHPRTPWTVRFHPNDSNIVASGCLGHECRIWNVRQRKCLRKHTFRASISCVSFSPSGEQLAVTSGCCLLLWNYSEPTPGGSIFTRTPDDPQGQMNSPDLPFGEPGPTYMPRQLLGGENPYHMVDFHPSGHMLMTGEKNRGTPPDGRDAPAQEEQFTLKLVLHRFDRHMGVKFAPPYLIVPRVVAYNDAGIHFSPCGKMLAACVPVARDAQEFHIAVLSVYGKPRVPIGSVLYSAPLGKGHVTALTNLKFSSTSNHLLAGFSFRPQNPVLQSHAEHYGDLTLGQNNVNRVVPLADCGVPTAASRLQAHVVDIYKVDREFRIIRSLDADMDISENGGGAEDEINVAVFVPRDGIADGIIYGTQKGRIRMFQLASGRERYPPGICDDNCKINRHACTLPPYVLAPGIPAAMGLGSVRGSNGMWARYAQAAAGVIAPPPPPLPPPQPPPRRTLTPLPIPPPSSMLASSSQSAPPGGFFVETSGYDRSQVWSAAAAASSSSASATVQPPPVPPPYAGMLSTHTSGRSTTTASVTTQSLPNINVESVPSESGANSSSSSFSGV